MSLTPTPRQSEAKEDPLSEAELSEEHVELDLTTESRVSPSKSTYHPSEAKCNIGCVTTLIKDWAGDPHATPLPWPQLSVAILITMTEGMSRNYSYGLLD